MFLCAILRESSIFVFCDQFVACNYGFQTSINCLGLTSRRILSVAIAIDCDDFAVRADRGADDGDAQRRQMAPPPAA